MLCYICNKQINKGDDLAVLSIPIKAIDEDGNYSFLGDFSQKEKISHASCFEKIPSKPNNFKTNITTEASVYSKDLHSALRQLGEEVSKDEIDNFLSDNQSLESLEQMISEWFKIRKKIV